MSLIETHNDYNKCTFYRMLMENPQLNYSYLSSLGIVDHVVLRSGHHSLQLFCLNVSSLDLSWRWKWWSYCEWRLTFMGGTAQLYSSFVHWVMAALITWNRSIIENNWILRSWISEKREGIITCNLCSSEIERSLNSLLGPLPSSSCP